MISAREVREAWAARSRLSPIASTMALTEDGLLLGAGTVLARWGSPHGEQSLTLDDRGERLLALLSVAYGHAVPANVLDSIRRAARDWRGGETYLAAIHLARTRLPPLPDGDEAPFRLFVAERLVDGGMTPRALLEGCDLDTSGLDLLKAGFDPDEPRIPAGSGSESGEWTDGGGGGVIPAAAGQPAQSNPPADKDPFFDTIYGPIHDLSQRLGIDESWPLGLAAHESGWLQPHNREINNPFGVTHAGGRDVQYDSMGEAVAAWERRYGSVVQGATSAADFVRLLRGIPYNERDQNWSQKTLNAIKSVQRRLDSWKSRHGL